MSSILVEQTTSSKQFSQKSSSQLNDINYRVDEIKQSLTIWRNILLPLNNLLEWEHKYDPFVIVGIITFVFIFIFQTDPPVLTLVSCVVLALVLIDLLVPFIIGILFKKDKWTPAKEAKYTRICERFANFEQHVKDMCEAALKMRKERPLMYLMIGAIVLAFVAFCGQRVDNLLLSYITTLGVCLTPGILNRQLIPMARQYLIDFWNNKTSSNVSKMNGNGSSMISTMPSVKTTAIIRPGSNQMTHTLYSTTAYGSNKTKAQ